MFDSSVFEMVFPIRSSRFTFNKKFFSFISACLLIVNDKSFGSKLSYLSSKRRFAKSQKRLEQERELGRCTNCKSSLWKSIGLENLNRELVWSLVVLRRSLLLRDIRRFSEMNQTFSLKMQEICSMMNLHILSSQ